ncbi:formate dehydrogenase accessory protein FdhE [Phenylobacterium sp.]|uniref:formate dehydrogenase accessory protein FdhE n=1 Tax=Phenylobacterium sp. TaxID=1871053 RepID=UPI0012148AE3|nr:formate dehydrogenase accessory protein FdhE [Phenylobacterium sp.]THD58117.1 MAG: formate dehydrogenase accessory protein FdhE [Phenylobacterium sp.]
MSDSHSVEPDPSRIGRVGTAPFVFLPDPEELFARRSARLRVLAASSELGPYLNFLAAIAEAQADIVSATPAPAPPPAEALARAREFAMPSLDRATAASDAGLRETCRALFAALAAAPKPAAAEAALARVRQADDAELDHLIAAALGDVAPTSEVAEHILLTAALQIHFTRLAAQLEPDALKPVGTGACPACGGPPAVSIISGRAGAEGARYAACALCSTLWNEVRVKCLACGSTEGVGYEEIEGHAGTVKAETCDTCSGYLKVLYQDKDPALEPIADDVASLALDQLLRGSDYRRAGVDPYLVGY